MRASGQYAFQATEHTGATGKPFLYVVVRAARVAAGVEELIAAAQERAG
ncbi:hypothetical protein [Streptomyces misionensis]